MLSHVLPTSFPVGSAKGLTTTQLISHSQALNTQNNVVIVPASGSAVTLTGTNGTTVGTDVTLTASCTFTMPSEGTSIWVRVRQTTTMGVPKTPWTAAVAGGPYNVAFTGVTWDTSNGEAPVMSRGAGSIDLFEFTRGTTSDAWTGSAYQNLIAFGINAAEYIWVNTAAGSAVTLPDPSIALGSELVLTEDLLVTLPAGMMGLQCYCACYQAGSGGPYTVTFQDVDAGTVGWPGETAPTMSTGANVMDMYQFWYSYILQTWCGVPIQGIAQA